MRTAMIGGQEFVIDPYKEPLVQLPGAIKGYMRGTLPYAVSDGRLPCAFCDPGLPRRKTRGGLGRDVPNDHLYHNLSLHVRLAHGLSPREYRDRIGLLTKTKLVSAALSSTISANVPTRFVAYAKEHGSEAAARGRAAFRRPVHDVRLEWGATPERLNKLGVCRDQIIAAVRAAAKANDGKVRQADLVRMGIWGSSIRRFFPDMRAVCAAAGVAYAGKPNWTDAEMLRAFRDLADKLGRTPTQKEMGSRFGMPSNCTYQTRFGGLSEVARRAGLPTNLPIPITFGDEIEILNRYAIGQNLADIAHAIRKWPPLVSAVVTKYGVPVVAGGSHAKRQEARAYAATIARRLAGMPDEATA